MNNPFSYSIIVSNENIKRFAFDDWRPAMGMMD